MNNNNCKYTYTYTYIITATVTPQTVASQVIPGLVYPGVGPRLPRYHSPRARAARETHARLRRPAQTAEHRSSRAALASVGHTDRETVIDTYINTDIKTSDDD